MGYVTPIIVIALWLGAWTFQNRPAIAGTLAAVGVAIGLWPF